MGGRTKELYAMVKASQSNIVTRLEQSRERSRPEINGWKEGR